MRIRLVVLCLSIALSLAGRVNAQEGSTKWTDEQWNEYNKAAEKGTTEAGGSTWIPDPWKYGCKEGQYCPTIANGIKAGKSWCLDPKKPCYKSHRNLTFKIYQEFGVWFEKYKGGRLAIHMASTARTESEGDPSSKTKSSIKEVGLLSIKATSAKNLNINACHPEANIWAAGYIANQHLIQIAEKYPQIKKAPRLEWMMLAGAMGAVGSTRVYNLIDASGALKTDESGELVYKSPHDRILKWAGWKANQLGAEVYSFLYKPIFGPIAGLTMFRLARAVAVYDILAEFYPDGFPWSEPKLIPRPEYLPEFPGYDLHGRCKQWPEWRELRPSADEVAEWKTSYVMPKKPETFIE